MGSYGHIIWAMLGISSTIICLLPCLKRRQSKQCADERLKMINESLEQAEERVMRLRDRHDQLVARICSYYMCHNELVEAVVGARKALDDELEFVALLRKMQLFVLSSFPHNVDFSSVFS
ncbi:hypothetical protein RND81_09G228500 [Saponaria officinalis]|uniref:Uncharacterized protein n=1 Tax=Saponaria officinalis TaxID=3572 RepID=A0AAW1IQ23_SAPOF